MEEKRICAMCKHLTFHDDTSDTGRCGLNKTIVNVLSERQCFSSRRKTDKKPKHLQQLKLF